MRHTAMRERGEEPGSAGVADPQLLLSSGKQRWRWRQSPEHPCRRVAVRARASPCRATFARQGGELVDFAEDDGSISFRKWWCGVGTRGHASRVAKTKYEVNPAAAKRARELIDARQYVLNSDWGQVQPDADAQNRYLESHSWDDYGRWHLALTTGVADERKARYAFVFGDFRRLHRTALIACVYRASEWRHKSVELAAHDLLQYLDAKTM